MMNGPIGPIRPSGEGILIAAVVTEARTAIPTGYSGQKPKYVLLTCTANCLVLPSDNIIVVTDSKGVLLTGGFSPGLVMDVAGSSHLSVKTISGTSSLYVTPLDDN